MNGLETIYAGFVGGIISGLTFGMAQAITDFLFKRKNNYLVKCFNILLILTLFCSFSLFVIY